MGIESYYINLKIDPTLANKLKNEYENNEIFQLAFTFKMFDSLQDNVFNAGIESLIDNFLPSCILIYEFLDIIKHELVSFKIDTCGNECDYSFKDKTQFLSFMYNIWERKILATYSQLGAVIINHKNYYKNRRKLHKKIYKRFDL